MRWYELVRFTRALVHIQRFAAISMLPVELKLGFADVAQMIATFGSCLIRLHHADN
jgi:hypothetical protein